jgi:hypothetical protein
MPRIKGTTWLTFPGEGGAYTPKDALDVLKDLIRKKTAMSGDLHQTRNLSELYLLAYYDHADIHNTPYTAPNFGWDEIAAIVKAEIAKNSRALLKVFLSNSLPPDRTATVLWGGICIERQPSSCSEAMVCAYEPSGVSDRLLP